jgi:hypothetical protein
MSLSLHRRALHAILSVIFLLISATLALAEDHPMLCSDGFGSFSSKFATGVTVSVEPVRKSAFASRVCSASLNWNGSQLEITPKASEIDLDVFGADLGLGVPVAAFQIRNVGSDKLVQYEIYSLKKPSQKLRTLTGGDYFNAADTDLDGRIEIWTDDAAAIDGFDNLSLSIFDAAPTVVLRLEKGHLVDVGAEFQSDYDRQIAALRSEIDPHALSDFKNSDGKLRDRSSLPIEEAHALMTTKVKVLEIIWAYLYSGREQQAWDALDAMWPSGDVKRIRTLIENARAAGIHSKVEGTLDKATFHIKKHAMIFEAEMQYNKDDHMHEFQAEVIPKPINMRRPPLPSTAQTSTNAEVVLNLVIDAAGKVRSAKSEGKADQDLIAATSGWKFVPAFQSGHAVASRMRYGVTPYQ